MQITCLSGTTQMPPEQYEWYEMPNNPVHRQKHDARQVASQRAVPVFASLS